jgi:hypothetical protein
MSFLIINHLSLIIIWPTWYCSMRIAAYGRNATLFRPRLIFHVSYLLPQLSTFTPWDHFFTISPGPQNTPNHQKSQTTPKNLYNLFTPLTAFLPSVRIVSIHSGIYMPTWYCTMLIAASGRNAKLLFTRYDSHCIPCSPVTLISSSCLPDHLIHFFLWKNLIYIEHSAHVWYNYNRHRSGR